MMSEQYKVHSPLWWGQYNSEKLILLETDLLGKLVLWLVEELLLLLLLFLDAILFSGGVKATGPREVNVTWALCHIHDVIR